MGYGTLLMPDHVMGGAWSPFPALAAAAAATTRLRIGTLVLDNDFRNPLMLAREAATLDVLSGGRFELGIGAGWWIRDNESLGIPYDRGAVRVERMAEAVRLLKRFFTEDEVTFEGRYYRHVAAQCQPEPVQSPHPPIHIAGGGRRILTIASELADIVAIMPMPTETGPVRAQREVTIEAAREKVGWIREAAGDRFERIELSLFQDATVTEDRERAIADLAGQIKRDPELIRSSIYRPIGTPDEIRAHILRLREHLGITYFCIRGAHVDELAPMVRELSGQAVSPAI